MEGPLVTVDAVVASWGEGDAPGCVAVEGAQVLVNMHECVVVEVRLRVVVGLGAVAAVAPRDQHLGHLAPERGRQVPLVPQLFHPSRESADQQIVRVAADQHLAVSGDPESGIAQQPDLA
jgi:hypothetical protein